MAAAVTALVVAAARAAMGRACAAAAELVVGRARVARRRSTPGSGTTCTANWPRPDCTTFCSPHATRRPRRCHGPSGRRAVAMVSRAAADVATAAAEVVAAVPAASAAAKARVPMVVEAKGPVHTEQVVAASVARDTRCSRSSGTRYTARRHRDSISSALSRGIILWTGLGRVLHAHERPRSPRCTTLRTR